MWEEGVSLQRAQPHTREHIPEQSRAEQQKLGKRKPNKRGLAVLLILRYLNPTLS